ncbi:MAG: hypothetical protein JSV84_13210 [Gemmatimonadota bacterium]|nr:MAG: hypothetical protein JSV84_13210 [Gemmatimonadota bacterium]
MMLLKRGVCLLLGLLFIFTYRFDSKAEFLSQEDGAKFSFVASDDMGAEVLIAFREPEIEAILEGDEIFHKVRMSRAGWSTEPGRPELPVLARLVAVPAGISVEVEAGQGEFTILRDIRVRSSQEADVARRERTVIDEGLSGSDELYPENVVEVETPVRMGRLRLVPLIVHPVQYNPVRGELKVYRSLAITLRYSEASGSGVGDRDGLARSEAFEDLYRSSVVNYRSVESAGVRGGYLFVTPDEYYEALEPLVEWKRQKGYHTDVLRLSQLGSNPDNNRIRNSIRNHYANTPVPLEYVVLIGDVEVLPTFFYQDEMETGRGWDAADHPYSMLEGNDYFPDAFVGRLSVASVSQLHNVVNKIVSYERDPYMVQSDWYKRALMVCNYEGNASARTTKLWVREKLLNSGYTDVPTSFSFANFESDIGFIESVVNSGVSFINYRGVLDWGGWTSPDHYYNILGLQNGFMLPVVTDMVCRAAAFYDDCPAEAWLRAGTVMSPRGGVAVVGPSAVNTKVYFNNVMDCGFYSGVFDDSLSSVGQALARAKMELYMQYPLNRGPGHAWNSVECYFHMYTLIGDPGLHMWTDIPRYFTVEHPSVIEVGSSVLGVRVKDLGNLPTAGAYVCLTRGDEILSGEYTGSDGWVHLPLSVGVGDFVTLTVTKPNFKPYQAVMVGREVSVSVVLSDYGIDDDASGGSTGDGDGRSNPGERLELSLLLENVASGGAADSVSCVVESDDPYVVVHQPVVDFGNIEPGESVWGREPCVLSISSDCPDRQEVALTLEIVDGDERRWRNFLGLAVEAPDFVLSDVQIEDSDQLFPNGRLDPGETVQVGVVLTNTGGKSGDNVWAVLRTADPRITIIDSTATFGTLPVGGEGTTTDDPLVIRADLRTFTGHRVQFSLVCESGSGMIDTVGVALTTGIPSSSDPVGPDSYGYFAYDNTDWRYYDKPTYDWVEIDPSYGGSGSVGWLVDQPAPEDLVWIDYPQGDTRVLTLPFSFRYYGRTFDQISVCSNGWLSLGSTWMTDFRNWSIPAILNPPNIIAPFWDDLYMGGGRVFTYHDVPGHRYIVEWSRVHNDYDDALETFEVILHDPEYYETVTGDGEILFQYRNVSNSDYAWNFATAGIESPDKKGGVEYTYAGLYPPGALELGDGAAIKFTTGKVLPDGPYLNYYDSEMDDDAVAGSQGDGDGLADAGERIELHLRLINYGEKMAAEVSAILKSGDPNALIRDSVQTFSDIGPGDVILGNGPFLVDIEPACENGHIIRFLVETRTAGAYCSSTNFNVEVVAPVIVYKIHGVEEIQGDGDGRPEAGETSALRITLENVGHGQATGVWGRLTTEDVHITLTDDAADFPDIAAAAIGTNLSDPFVFTLDDEISHHHASFELSVFSNGDHYSTVLQFRIVVERAPILLVDDDGGDTLETYFTEALSAQDWGYDYYDRLTEGGLDTFMIREYKTLVWFAGNERDSTLTPFDQGRLKAFLHRGGSLFLTGQDIGYDLVEDGTAEDAAFYHDYLRADYVMDASGIDILVGVPQEHLIAGVSQANFLGLVHGGAGNQNSPSVIVPLPGASPVYTYSTTNDVAGLKYYGGYKLVYFAFGFEGVGCFIGQDHAETRARLMRNITEWCMYVGDKGDVNGDGVFNVRDVIMTVQISHGCLNPSVRQLWAADNNGDGQISVVDILGIIDKILTKRYLEVTP